MGVRRCGKCDEMVDEAKAFCPGCGHAMVTEQERDQKSNFDTAEHTMQLGQTMYNQLLSDMGLNLSKAPDPPEKRVEVLAPAVAKESGRNVQPSLNVKSSGGNKWVTAVIAAVLLFFLVLILIGGLGFIYYYLAR